ncbi:pentatricopeptide repeat-containing protein At4g18975, chloroplastic-like isoform X2 [Silene latifolia]|uniref:pentatricopeptide repeat-containing protein At4g18975, chloroplastic-like isoform X2 n=1 Tax=Silene latifolia TaxID=37657 RepID=UPI003D77C713
MSWLRTAVNKAVEVGNKNNITRTVKNYADSVVLQAGQAVAEGAKLLQDRITQTWRIQIGVIGCQPHRYWFTTTATTTPYPLTPTPTQSNNIKDRKWVQPSNAAIIRNEIPKPVGHNLSRKEKTTLLIKTLLEPGDSKDAIYGALDTYVAWEQNFPIAALKHVLLTLQREQQWHRVVQVIKWMLSKGQGNTMGTYQQLILALDKDHRADEAHNFWMKKMGNDLHSVPWQACHLMISVYLRNAMLDHIVKLFKRLEAFGRKPPDKSIVQKVVDAYDLLDLKEDKERLLEKYDALLKRKTKESDNSDKKPKKVTSRMHTLSGRKRSVIKALERKHGTSTQQNA